MRNLKPMKLKSISSPAKLSLLIAFASASLPAAYAQGRLQSMPRYDRYERLRGEIFGSVSGGDIQVSWTDGGKSFTFARGSSKITIPGQDKISSNMLTYDIASRHLAAMTSTAPQEPAPPTQAGRRRLQPARGRQFDTAYSPDGKLKAVTKDRNVYISNADGTGQYAVTTDGSPITRVKYGIASWVYGEELGVREAMWWSPDGKKLAYYRFDESKVPDYYIAMNQIDVQDALVVEAYPKAGVTNPVVGLYVYDLASKKSTLVDTSFGDTTLGEYVYDVRWSPDGKELLFNRTNRKQNRMQLAAANPDTGKCRVIVEESRPQSWTDNHPGIQWLEDKPGQPRRFLWISERNGFRNVYLGDLSGAPLKPVTQYPFEVFQILEVDEKDQVLYLSARDGDNPYKLQLHRINFDGTGDKRLTDPAFSHSVQIAPDHRHYIDVVQTLDMPPATRLCDMNGAVLQTIATADMSKYQALGLNKAERLEFKAADGHTDLYGYLMFPSDFDPSKKYPLLVSVYGGPESGSTLERFLLPNPITELGFLVAWFDGRGTNGRGKVFGEAMYDKLGIVEIDDQAAGAKYLAQRPYVDAKNIGIFGTSYGGYSSVMAILRYPDVFHAAVASSPVTDWRNYDSIYTERYMGLPTTDDNAAGYDNGAAKKYAANLAGRLMIYYGTADNNVHDSNSMQLIQALINAGKSYDTMVGPDQGHSQIEPVNRMWEFFIDNLILGNDRTKR